MAQGSTKRQIECESCTKLLQFKVIDLLCALLLCIYWFCCALYMDGNDRVMNSKLLSEAVSCLWWRILKKNRHCYERERNREKEKNNVQNSLFVRNRSRIICIVNQSKNRVD